MVRRKSTTSSRRCDKAIGKWFYDIVISLLQRRLMHCMTLFRCQHNVTMTLSQRRRQVVSRRYHDVATTSHITFPDVVSTSAQRHHDFVTRDVNRNK